jgi:prepilin-type N-terminal cleavage/methylation domain-containing protein/prepilin-type processing-associated H-X9-DG protein
MASDAAGRTRSAFSLIELLLVIGIIGLLFAIIMPMVNSVRLVVKQMGCQNQQRQIGLYVTSNILDNHGKFLAGNNIFNFSIDKDFRRLILCPEGNLKFSYTANYCTMGYNGAFLGGCISTPVLIKPAFLSEIKNPGETVLIGDSTGTYYLEYFACGAAVWPWHRRGYYANVLAVDGHVQSFWTRTPYSNTDLYRPIFQGGMGDALTNGPYRGYTWHDRN